ncbi:hypothetical protein K431DRAFT_289502 [Polychaeton citri CBS 116435]|uniref:Uncharacterized protein n=1 Tax=Polychaeton citri CBS 116435 TaxID=1314669 RepID=A0A9P4PWP0_9PEZI|nr:hypothetical protein K431DRAFT_289502 [Polychaeton citri CBS 116435]
MEPEHTFTTETLKGDTGNPSPTSSGTPSSPTIIGKHHQTMETSQRGQTHPIGPLTDSRQNAEARPEQRSNLSMPPPPRPVSGLVAQEGPPSQDTPSIQPDREIDSFDWPGLQARHDQVMGEFAYRERDIMDEFGNLCNYFRVWASSLPEHEQPRSSKRLKTQIEFVKHKEHELEAKRVHYTKVVEAFENALKLF